MVIFDGTRTIAFLGKTTRLQNRRFIDLTYRYPELQQLNRNIKAKEAILDGEIIVFQNGLSNFYKLQEREHQTKKFKINLLSEQMPAVYVAFDLLYLNGKKLVTQPLIKRRELLSKTVKEDERILVSQYIFEYGKSYFKEAKKRGLEGIMAKQIGSPYLIGMRSRYWLKIKNLKTLDCVIAGYTKGEGWRTKYFGALVLGCYYRGKLTYIGRVGTGLNVSEFELITPQFEKLKTKDCPFSEKPRFPSDIEVTWIKPELVCEVKFMNLSRDLKLRAPSFIRLRNDKWPKDCELEI
ncbi:MAG: non-homologous end-joining DNA ligase [Euryarchaeota archaeon]|nr:non-homologous end-joining DNA ligase [Euryarchaeota archaeon]